MNDIARKILHWSMIVLGSILLALILSLVLFRAYTLLKENKTSQEAAPATGRFVNGGDVSIFIQEAGEGHPVLFIHGTAAWGEIWRDTMDVLAANGFRAIVVDLPPFGYSEKPNVSSYDTKDQAQRIAAVVDSLGLENVTLVGHSFGSRATIEAALMLEGRVTSLVLADAALGLNATSEESTALNILFAVKPIRNAVVATTVTNPLLTKTFLNSLIYKKEAASEKNIEMLQRPMTIKGVTNDVGNWLEVFLSPQQPTNMSSYSRLTMPILLLWGEKDSVTPLNQGEYLATLLPNAKLVVLEEVGHIPHLEDPEQFNNELLQFLQERNLS